MAESDESKQAREQIESGFDRIDKSSKQDLFAAVTEINKERDEYINKTVSDLVSEKYLETHFSGFRASKKSKEDYIRDVLSLEQKIYIIGEYTNERQIFEGNASVRVKLTDFAERKKEDKLRYKKEALDIIKAYEEALNENKTKIQTLENDILKIKEQIASAEAKLLEIMGKEDETLSATGRVKAKTDKDKAIAEVRKQINELNNKLQKQEGLLAEFKSIQAQFEIELKKRKSEIEETLQKQNIFIYNRKGEKETAETSEETTQKSEETKPKQKGNSNNNPVRASDRAIARAMMKDFYNASPERQRALLDSMDNQGILDMARKLGWIKRAKFNVILSQRLSELPGDSVTFGATSIKKEELSHIRRRNLKQLKAIREEMDKFNEKFKDKTPEEIEEFEKKLQYVRIGALLSETGMFRGIGRRFLEGLFKTSKRSSVFELSKSLAEYARIKKARIREKGPYIDSLRVIMGMEAMHPLAKEGQNMLERDTKKSIFRD